jgi:hypothetical protein
MQFARDIRDRRFLKPDLTEQTFCDLDNQLMSVSVLRFPFRSDILTILTLKMGAARFVQRDFRASIGLFNLTQSAHGRFPSLL